MEILTKKRLAQAVGACLMVGVLQGTAWAAPSLSQPGQDIEPQAPKPEAEVHDDTPTGEGLQEEVHFKVENFRLEAPDLHLEKEPLVKILQEGMKEDQRNQEKAQIAPVDIAAKQKAKDQTGSRKSGAADDFAGPEPVLFFAAFRLFIHRSEPPIPDTVPEAAG